MAPLTSTRLASLISSFLILISSAAAMVRIQAAGPTPVASLFVNGISPRPTNPPGSNGVPRELLRRKADIEFPPPANWCGFIGSDYIKPLSCTNTKYTCIFTGPVAVGCCAKLNGACSALNTQCMDYTANWAPYKSDTSRLICSNTSLRYCASYVFPQGHRLFYCESTAYAITSVQFLNDYYYTAIGSTVGPSFADPSTTPVERVSTSLIADSTSSRGLSPSPTIIPVRITTTPRKKGLGAGAIAGIGAGIGLVLLAVIAGIIFFACKRKRNRNQVTPAQPAPAAFNNNAPMQQQGYMTTPYQNPSQPNAQYHNSQTTFLNDSKSPYDSTRARTYGQPSPMSSPLLVHGDPINRASTVSPPFSHNSSVLGNTRPLSPNLPMTGGADVNGDNIPDYYKHPTGPISEVDGTGPQPQIYGTAGVPQYAGGGAQELGQAQASSHLPHVHEVPAQQEPKYVPYNPGIATPPPQQYSMQQQYPTRNPQPAQGAPVGQPRPAAPYSGPWEIGS